MSNIMFMSSVLAVSQCGCPILHLGSYGGAEEKKPSRSMRFTSEHPGPHLAWPPSAWPHSAWPQLRRGRNFVVAMQEGPSLQRAAANERAAAGERVGHGPIHPKPPLHHDHCSGLRADQRPVGTSLSTGPCLQASYSTRNIVRTCQRPVTARMSISHLSCTERTADFPP